MNGCSQWSRRDKSDHEHAGQKVSRHCVSCLQLVRHFTARCVLSIFRTVVIYLPAAYPHSLEYSTIFCETSRWLAIQTYVLCRHKLIWVSLFSPLTVCGEVSCYSGRGCNGDIHKPFYTSSARNCCLGNLSQLRSYEYTADNRALCQPCIGIKLRYNSLMFCTKWSLVCKIIRVIY